MRITKVYTRTGDKGKTRLAGGQQVWKNSRRVEAYGTVDELNSMIGLLCAMSHGVQAAEEFQEDLYWIQNKLFDLGGLLATAKDQVFKNMPCISSSDTLRLERLIDKCQSDLQPLKEFILPGGGLFGSLFHVARAICRRAERRCVSLMKEEAVDAQIVVFLNRLSDAFFVLARWVAMKQGIPERFWQREEIPKQQGRRGATKARKVRT
jgi:cob(I)alamin adenosyltransferase